MAVRNKLWPATAAMAVAQNVTAQQTIARRATTIASVVAENAAVVVIDAKAAISAVVVIDAKAAISAVVVIDAKAAVMVDAKVAAMVVLPKLA